MLFVYRFHCFLIKFVSLVLKKSLYHLSNEKKKKAYRRYSYHLFWWSGFVSAAGMDPGGAQGARAPWVKIFFNIYYIF